MVVYRFRARGKQHHGRVVPVFRLDLRFAERPPGCLGRHSWSRPARCLEARQAVDDPGLGQDVALGLQGALEQPHQGGA